MTTPAAPEDPDRPEVSFEAFLEGYPTIDLEEWRWVWQADHSVPITSERPFFGRLIVGLKKLFRPLVKAPQADLWDRQRAFNIVVVSYVSQLADLRKEMAGLGRDLQSVQKEVVEDLRSVQKDYIRDVGDLTARLEFLEAFLRDGLTELTRHNDALFTRVDQKIDRFRRATRDSSGGESG